MLGTTFVLALRSIRRHLLRSFLTILGIVIGVGAVVTMVTLGNATTAAVQKQIASLGTNILQEIGRAHVCTPVTNAPLVCRLLLEKKKTAHNSPPPSHFFYIRT